MPRFSALMTILALAAPLAAWAHQEPEIPHVDPADDVAKSTLVAVGQQAPVFTAEMLGEGSFDLAAHQGEVVLINWFATWCGPCKAEMPHLQTEVWERFEKDGLVMVSVAREEKADVVAPFVKKYEATWPFALDPERKAFAKYATAYIPRNIVVDRTGKIVFQSQGYEEKEFKAMIEVIAAELAK